MNTRCFRVYIIVLFVASLLITNNGIALAQNAPNFSPPLGYHSGIKYSPRYTYDGGTLIENTDYGIQNPDLKYSSACFSIEMRLLLHAGEDLYRVDGSPANGDEVTAVADGTVYDYDSRWDYPGEAVVLRHPLGSGYVYSVYMHIENVPAEISNGQTVHRGQKLGTILYQPYDGRYPEHHGTDDSHLHFEMRYFASANGIYTDHPLCNKGDVAGRGYTYPGYPPDTYPNSSQHYTDPTTFIQRYTGAFLPLIMQPPCNQGTALIFNGNFEQGPVSWVQQGQYAIITNYSLVPKHSGSWIAWLGGYNNANDVLYQFFNVPRGATSTSLTYYVWIGTDEPSPQVPHDYFYVRLRNEGGGTILQTIDTLNNSSTRGTWLIRQFTINISSYIGQNLRLSFEATTNATNRTSFYVDDVGLTLNCGGANSLPPGVIVPEVVATQQIESGNPAVIPIKPTSTPHPYP